MTVSSSTSGSTKPSFTGRLIDVEDAPSPPRLPLVGSLPFIDLSEGFIPGVARLAERYRGEGLLRIVAPGGRAVVFVLNASLLTEMCDEQRWEKVLDGPLPRIRDFAGDGLFTAYSDEPNWFRANRILSPGFSGDSMDRYFPSMRAVLDDMLAHWRRAKSPVDVVSDMTKLTLDTISLCGFDYRFRSFDRPALDPFLVALGRALQESVDGIRRPPFLVPVQAYRSWRFDRDVALMFGVVDRVIAERKKQPREQWPKDFLSLMLERADPKTGEKLDDQNIRYQILTFLVAGHETTSGLLAFTLHHLARQPALVEALRAEADAVLGSDNAEPTMQQVMSLGLLQRTLSEALRLWPTVTAIMRAPKEDTVLGGRYFVPKGRSLIALLPSIHLDAAAWPNPTNFDPSRFLPENTKGRPAGAYKPFGIGKRSCTGRHFALVESALCLTAVLREFDLAPPTGPLKLTPTASPKPRDFMLGLRPRSR